MSAFTVPVPLVPDLIAQHGAAFAGKPAVVEGARSLDWRGFDAATNRFGNALLAARLAPGERVAVLAGNSLEMLVTLFGCGKAGLSVVPLNISITDAKLIGWNAQANPTGYVAVVLEEIEYLRSLMENDRAAYLPEILAQHENAPFYWISQLGMTDGSKPKSMLLMQMAMRIGEMVAIYYKAKFQRVRPSAICPPRPPKLRPSAMVPSPGSRTTEKCCPKPAPTSST